MSVINILQFLTDHLIEGMFVVCMVALVLRFIAHKVGKSNQSYFNGFSRAVIKLVEEEEARHEGIEDIDIWFDNLLHDVEEHLPDRSVRFNKSRGDSLASSEKFDEYSEGRRSVILAMKQQLDALKSPFPPNFNEMSIRVLDRDRRWSHILKVVPVDSVARGLDILPNLFIVGGILGTFIGITGALPLIAGIDISQLGEAGPVLSEFVTKVAYSMNTSIAGIVFSVLMTLITALFPLDFLRDDVEKNFEKAVECIWYRIHGNKVTKGERAIQGSVESMAKQVAELLEAIHGTLQQEKAKPGTKRKIGIV